jgi:hypothetical protein
MLSIDGGNATECFSLGYGPFYSGDARIYSLAIEYILSRENIFCRSSKKMSSDRKFDGRGLGMSITGLYVFALKKIF